MSRLKQAIFGTKNCNCNRRRKDGFHSINCASWKNTWRWKKAKIVAQFNSNEGCGICGDGGHSAFACPNQSQSTKQEG